VPGSSVARHSTVVRLQAPLSPQLEPLSGVAVPRHEVLPSGWPGRVVTTETLKVVEPGDGEPHILTRGEDRSRLGNVSRTLEQVMGRYSPMESTEQDQPRSMTSKDSIAGGRADHRAATIEEPP
jgi:hypothetical protein